MNYNSKIAPVWQLPVAGAERCGNAYIHPQAKYHCFVNNTSLCKKYNQWTEDYDDGITIESGVVLQVPHHVCKRCYGAWKSIYQVGENYEIDKQIGCVNRTVLR